MNRTEAGDSRILHSAMITSFMTTFMSSALNLSIPALESYFSVSARTVSWVVSAYTISIAAMSLPMGRISDLSGRRKMFLAGISGFGILCLLCIFAPSIGAVITIRVLMGVMGAMIFATNNSILISSYPASQRGRVLGYSVAATYIGLTAGPVAGGILNSILGWRSIFAVSVLVSCTAFFLAFRAVPADRPDRAAGESGTDAAGTVLYTAAIAASLYGMTNLGGGVVSAAVMIAGITGLAAFFIHEGRREAAGGGTVMKVSMFSQSRTFTFSSLAALLNYGATFAISYNISIYLQVILGIPSGTAGLMLVVMPAVQAAFSPLTGSLSDRVRPAILASSGMGICAAALLLFSRISETTSVWYILGVLFITGAGFALFSSPNTNAILSCVKPQDYGVANSIIATMRTYGQSSGMAVLSIITAAVLGNGSLESSPAADILRLMHISFLVFSAICVVGLFFSLARDRQ